MARTLNTALYGVAALALAAASPEPVVHGQSGPGVELVSLGTNGLSGQPPLRVGRGHPPPRRGSARTAATSSSRAPPATSCAATTTSRRGTSSCATGSRAAPPGERRLGRQPGQPRLVRPGDQRRRPVRRLCQQGHNLVAGDTNGVQRHLLARSPDGHHQAGQRRRRRVSRRTSSPTDGHLRGRAERGLLKRASNLVPGDTTARGTSSPATWSRGPSNGSASPPRASRACAATR